MALSIGRQPDESFYIDTPDGERIVVTITDINRKKTGIAHIAITAPRDFEILRSELCDKQTDKQTDHPSSDSDPAATTSETTTPPPPPEAPEVPNAPPLPMPAALCVIDAGPCGLPGGTSPHLRPPSASPPPSPPSSS